MNTKIMTVEELITELKKYDPDAVIYLTHDVVDTTSGGYIDVDDFGEWIIAREETSTWDGDVVVLHAALYGLEE